MRTGPSSSTGGAPGRMRNFWTQAFWGSCWPTKTKNCWIAKAKAWACWQAVWSMGQWRCSAPRQNLFKRTARHFTKGWRASLKPVRFLTRRGSRRRRQRRWKKLYRRSWLSWRPHRLKHFNDWQLPPATYMWLQCNVSRPDAAWKLYDSSEDSRTNRLYRNQTEVIVKSRADANPLSSFVKWQPPHDMAKYNIHIYLYVHIDVCTDIYIYIIRTCILVCLPYMATNIQKTLTKLSTAYGSSCDMEKFSKPFCRTPLISGLGSGADNLTTKRTLGVRVGKAAECAPQELRTFVERPTSDTAPLGGLAACFGPAASTPAGEDLFGTAAPPKEKATASTSAGGADVQRITFCNRGRDSPSWLFLVITLKTTILPPSLLLHLTRLSWVDHEWRPPCVRTIWHGSSRTTLVRAEIRSALATQRGWGIPKSSGRRAGRALAKETKEGRRASGFARSFRVSEVTDTARVEEALELASAFHVNNVGLVETWLGCGLLIEWTGHGDPPEALTVGLVELITRYTRQMVAMPRQRMQENQRTILRGLVPWETALELYSQAYLLCVKARKEVAKEEIGGLLNLLPPVVRHLSGLPHPKKYLKQKAHGWADHLSKLLTLAYLSAESYKVTSPPEEPPWVS